MTLHLFKVRMDLLSNQFQKQKCCRKRSGILFSSLFIFVLKTKRTPLAQRELFQKGPLKQLMLTAVSSHCLLLLVARCHSFSVSYCYGLLVDPFLLVTATGCQVSFIFCQLMLLVASCHSLYASWCQCLVVAAICCQLLIDLASCSQFP